MTIIKLWLNEVRTKVIRHRFRMVYETMGKNATRSYLVFTCVDNERGELRAMPCSEKLVNTWKRTILDEPNIEGLTIKPNWIPDKPYHIKHQMLDCRKWTHQYAII